MTDLIFCITISHGTKDFLQILLDFRVFVAFFEIRIPLIWQLQNHSLQQLIIDLDPLPDTLFHNCFKSCDGVINCFSFHVLKVQEGHLSRLLTHFRSARELLLQRVPRGNWVFQHADDKHDLSI